MISDYISDFFIAGTSICKTFLIDFRYYFGFFTSETISELFVMHFGFLDVGEKKIILRQGAYPLPCDLDFSYSLVCGYIWSCILLLRIHKTVEWIKLMFHPTKQVSS